MTPFQEILQLTLKSTEKLLNDPRINADPDDPDTELDYQQSQFKYIYGSEAYANDRSRNPFKGDPDSEAPFYPLTMDETLDLQELRILDQVQLGWIPLEDIENVKEPSLFISDATDRHRLEPGDVSLKQVKEAIPLNFRFVNKEPENHILEQKNIIMVDKVLEGLKYVLNEEEYRNLAFPRRGYNQPTVIRNLNFVQALNLEEFLSPYEVMDFLFQITVREQRSRSQTEDF